MGLNFILEPMDIRRARGCLVVPFFKEGGSVKSAARLGEEVLSQVEEVLGREFKGGLEEIYSLPATIGEMRIRLLLAGIGERGEFQLDAVRRAYGRAAAAADEMKIDTLSLILPDAGDVSELAQAAVEGCILALYRFETYKSERSEHTLREVRILVDADVRDAVDRAVKICEGVKLARDLANMPSNDCTPERFTEIATSAIRDLGVRVRVYGMRELEEMGMNGIISVGRGSAHEPRLIELEYDGGGDLYIVVGKAVTFDSGGISLKPSERLEEMKYDKSGGASVVGIVAAAALLKLPIRLIGLIPVVENMPGGNALKPGDVIRFRNGKTAEIISTDAEGRLILADALAYASEKRPKIIIDLATLTSACVIALGNHASGLFSNDDELAEKLIESGERTGERLWRLPLWKPYYDQLKSDVADMRNVGGRAAGAITAAAFLSNFVKDTRWAHIDIAGTAWIQEQSERKSYASKGATGVGVRLIIDLLMRESGISANPSGAKAR